MDRAAKNTKPLVFVGLSGGVDSSVSAAMLIEQGYQVVGVFMKVWQPDFIECTWKEERRDAMRVAAHLGIPFLTFDLEKEYKRGVADYMINEYRAGRTPNPDVMCNKEVKFSAFLKKARAMGADFIATGHYAQNSFSKKEHAWIMQKGKDQEKDQSYFLWTLGQDALACTLFPVGGLQKSKVRALAKKYGLPTAQKKDSQGVCFLGKLDMKDFLKHYIKKKRGSVLDLNGEVIGSHDGAVFYTIGERHGFLITKKSTTDAPMYIVAKDIKKNTLTVAPDMSFSGTSENDMKRVQLEQCNWIGAVPIEGRKVQARLRYRQTLEPCEIISIYKRTAVLNFKHPQPTASSGQSAVLYDGSRCLGGGILS